VPALSRRAPGRPRARRVALPLLAAVAAVALGACAAFTPQTPKPTATDFAGIVEELARVNVGVANVVAGDPGCDDQRLARTAISFDASGLDQPEPTRVFLYAFKNVDVFDELRPFVDLCARSYVADPADYATIDAPPYVFAGSGPWAGDFERALRDALERAAVGG
jgi:hypothetical protein